MPRFVILTHDWPFPHWDLMLESDEKLLVWRLHDEPQLDTPIQAEKSADHRLKYLDYTGPVSGNRGSVDRWDAGNLLSLVFCETQIVAKIQSHRFERIIVLVIRGDSIVFHIPGKVNETSRGGADENQFES